MEIIRPQLGPQTAFLSTPADICIYGGAAGGGKTFALLLEPVRHIQNSKFGAVLLRKNITQITAEGGLWDESFEVYAYIRGARPVRSPKLQWRFSSGARVSFMHIERDEELYKWQGTQIALLEFDELTHFSEKTFFYLFSRCRTGCGIAPYVRATCNPDADSWVAKFIEWWIDPDTGYPIPERSGVLRYMLRREESIVWGDSPQELWERFGLQSEEERSEIKSVTFIASSLQDNQILLKNDPSYLANLKALPLVERERLLHGNWKIKPAAGMYFKRSRVHMLEKIPDDVVRWVRAWDMAATEDRKNSRPEDGPAYTAGVLLGKRRCGRILIADVINQRLNAADVQATILNTAVSDKAKYRNVRIRLNQDPGQAGKAQAEQYLKLLSGFSVHIERETGSKETRAEPLSAQWLGTAGAEKGNVDVLIADWNEAYFNQLESFPEGKFKDMADASATGYDELESGPQLIVPPVESVQANHRNEWHI